MARDFTKTPAYYVKLVKELDIYIEIRKLSEHTKDREGHPSEASNVKMSFPLG